MNTADQNWRKAPFLLGVFLISFSVLLFQIVQTRILSVIAWYYLAFFGISMAMLGMTVGAVLVYLRNDRFGPENLRRALTLSSLACAVSIPVSMAVQFSLITTLALSFSTIASWILLTAAMALPYVFAGIAISLALTRSPFPVNQVYGVDLVGAALGCVSVIFLLNVFDAPSTMICAGVAAAVASWFFSVSARRDADQPNPVWRRPGTWVVALLVLMLVNAALPIGFRPLLVKDRVEKSGFAFEKWNSFSRIIALPPATTPPVMWGPSPKLPKNIQAEQVHLNIDGMAGTTMFNYDGTRKSIDFLRYDLVNLAYNLPGLDKGAVIGVGGGRDIMSAHLYGVKHITGVELNPIFVDLHTKNPKFREFSGLTKLPDLKLHVDDARSWFASTDQKFDVVQMSMIDTWASTGAGAFSLSENGLYTLQGWRAFFKSLSPDGVFTVSRWYSPGNVNETGRMISLAAGTLHDSGIKDARSHIFVANADKIATLIVSKKPFTKAQLATLREHTKSLGFEVLVAPDQPSKSKLLNDIVNSTSTKQIDAVADKAYLDLSVPTDNKPFFFNQLKPSRLGELISDPNFRQGGVVFGNLLASLALLLILAISIAAVVITILLPLRGAAKESDRRLVTTGSTYFFLIGLGFMLAEISMLQYFGVYLGHPIYSLGVCLFSLILATGLGSLASGKLNIGHRGGIVVWGVITGAYLLFLQSQLANIFVATDDNQLSTRIAISVGLLVPLGFLLGFAFPTGMRLVESVDAAPAPWFWGINGATGVLASVLGVVISMNFGIDKTATVAALCYLLLIPVGRKLVAISADRKPPADHEADALPTNAL